MYQNPKMNIAVPMGSFAQLNCQAVALIDAYCAVAAGHPRIFSSDNGLYPERLALQRLCEDLLPAAMDIMTLAQSGNLDSLICNLMVLAPAVLVDSNRECYRSILVNFISASHWLKRHHPEHYGLLARELRKLNDVAYESYFAMLSMHLPNMVCSTSAAVIRTSQGYRTARDEEDAFHRAFAITEEANMGKTNFFPQGYAPTERELTNAQCFMRTFVEEVYKLPPQKHFAYELRGECAGMERCLPFCYFTSGDLPCVCCRRPCARTVAGAGTIAVKDIVVFRSCCNGPMHLLCAPLVELNCDNVRADAFERLLLNMRLATADLEGLGCGQCPATVDERLAEEERNADLRRRRKEWRTQVLQTLVDVEVKKVQGKYELPTDRHLSRDERIAAARAALSTSCACRFGQDQPFEHACAVCKCVLANVESDAVLSCGLHFLCRDCARTATTAACPNERADFCQAWNREADRMAASFASAAAWEGFEREEDLDDMEDMY